MFDRKIRQNPLLRSRILYARPEVMHRPKSYSPSHFDIKNIWQIRAGK